MKIKDDVIKCTSFVTITVKEILTPSSDGSLRFSTPYVVVSKKVFVIM